MERARADGEHLVRLVGRAHDEQQEEDDDEATRTPTGLPRVVGAQQAWTCVAGSAAFELNT
jgi:hypothetical protein